MSHYLRFYPDGVLITSSPQAPEQVATWFNRSRLRLDSYTVEGQELTIPTRNRQDETTNWRGEALGWFGRIEGDVIQMTQRSRSSTDARTYVFMPVHGEPGPPPPLKAEKPNPMDGAKDVRHPLLQWSPGETAALHDVYFGTDPNLGPHDRVAARHDFTLYWHKPGLVPGTTYYWRIDEIEAYGTVHQGDVWRFTAK